jgi:uncharacterized protein YecE (DUF72 family)
MGSVFIGTSGWMYKDWGATFYPPDMKRGYLTYLSQEFNTVEVNSSFYHLPLKQTFQKWREETPAAFVFAVKLSRFITHQKRLLGVSEPLARFMARAHGMQEKLGVVLIQLPPNLAFDEKILGNFLKLLKKYEIRFALEPRHRSWMMQGSIVRQLLHNENVALVFPHSAKIPSFAPTDENLIADFIYIRFHGPSEWAASRYGARRLAPWAARIKAWRRQRDVFVYFNNDIHGHAIHDARTLKRLLTIE